MKKTVQIMGIVAAIFLIIGFGLFILAGWGSLVEYHAFEWRGIDPAGASPLTRATGNLSYWFLGTGVIAFIPFFITVIRNSRKTHKKYPEQAQDLLEEGQNQVDS